MRAIVRRAERESDRIHRLLKDRIVRLELPPGRVLHEAQLMRELRAGRTPLREALQRLALDHLVVILPRRGTFVADISIDDLRYLWEARLPLEGYSARLAAERMTAMEVGALSTLVARAEEVARSNSFHAIGEADKALHEAIRVGARNPYLHVILTRLYTQTQRIWYHTQSRTPEKDALMHLEWRAIVEAIQQRNPDAAERAMREHVMHSRTVVLGAL